MSEEVETDGAAVPPMDTLAKVYRKMAAKMALLTQTYDAEIAVIKEQQDAIKTMLKDQMLELGSTSVKTAQGTVMLGTKTRYHTSDWDAFNKFVIEHDALALFEKRIAQTNMAQFLNENPGVSPAGLNSSTEYTISVRKPT